MIKANRVPKLNPAIIAEILRNAGSGGGPVVIPATVGWWPFTGDQNTFTLTDRSGNAANLTIDGFSWNLFDATYPGIYCVSWNGSARQADAAQYWPQLDFDGTKPLSLSAWINIYPGGQGGAMICTQNPANAYAGYGFFTMVNGQNEIYFNFVAPDGTAAGVYSNTGGSLTVGVTYNFAMTYDGSGKAAGIKMYINGVNVPTTVSVDSLDQSTASTAPFTMGSVPTQEFNLGIQGSQTDCRVWNVTLTAPEVAALYAAGPQPPPS